MPKHIKVVVAPSEGIEQLVRDPLRPKHLIWIPF
jgi:hypothetical protein